MNMKRVLALFSVAIIAASSIVAQDRKGPPVTRVDNVAETIHGRKIVDPYRWLEDKDSPETRAWLKEQMEYTSSLLGKFAGRDRIKQRLEQLMRIDTISSPAARGNRYFLYKRRADQNQAVLYVRQGLTGKDEVLIDPNTMSADQTVSASALHFSRDGKHVIYGVRQGGEDEVTVRILDVDTRKDLPDMLPRARYSGVSMTPDKKSLYFSRFTAEGPRVYHQPIGAGPEKAHEIFGSGYDPGKIIGASVSSDGGYLQVTVSHGSAAEKIEVYVKPLNRESGFITVVNDLTATFGPQIEGDRMFVRTNWNAPNGRILEINLKDPSRDNWREVIPESTHVLTGFSLAGGRIFAGYLENVVSRVKVYEPSGKHVRDITFPTLGSGGGVSGRWDSDEAFFSFSSLAQPTTIYRYQISSGKQEVWARLNVPVDSDSVEVKQVWFESKDKTRIPMFIAHKKGLRLDGNRPTLLTGYGGFNISRTPGYSAGASFWIENGGVYALPNLRGGGEFGEKWHRAGMLEKKQNVFDDFIAAAEWLIANKYTTSSKLAISGGSNGGLLVGAAMTQRPELFQAVVCSVPLLDMVRYHRFLVARFWVPEYGSSDDPEQFGYILEYSPYHQVKMGTKYPAVLFVTGDADTRVDPLHARKMAALMQSATGSERPVLLQYDTKAGHSGGLPVTKQIEDLADEMSFLFWQLGVDVD